MGAWAQAATLTITSRDDSGPGTLRQAIADANAGDILTFDTTAMGGNSITVHSGLNVSKRLFFDGEGEQVVIGASGSFVLFYLNASAAESSFRGLALVDSGQALYLHQSDDVQVLNCRLGVDWTDTDRGNSWGIMVQDCDGVVIGAPSQGNVISGNSANGVVVKNSRGTVIQGNRVGTTSAGTLARPNAMGIRVVDGSTATLVGGDRGAGEGNLVSGNTSYGIEISNNDGYGGTGAAPSGNTLAGNIVGLNLGQTSPLDNDLYGIYVSYSPNNQIGLPQSGKGNIVAGNGAFNMFLDHSDGTRVQNNRIGINENDTVSGLGNNYGLLISECNGCLIGGDRGALSLDANIISGHAVIGRYGISLGVANARGNTIAGNLIGVDSTGSLPRPNDIGITVAGDQNLIGGGYGGTWNQGNLISGNSTTGIALSGRENRLLGNWIGTDANGNGTPAIPNGDGILLTGTASAFNEIGDGTWTGRNVIAGNRGDGIHCALGFGHRILNNRIGADANGATHLENGGCAIRVDGAEGCLIGRENEGNQICGSSSQPGIYFAMPGTAGTTITGNTFNWMSNGFPASERIQELIRIESGAHDNSVGLMSTGAGNLLYGGDTGIALYTAGTDRNGFFGNTVCGFANTATALGIALNDGANSGKAAPVVTGAGAALINGTSAPGDHIQIFRADRAEGYAGGSLALLATVTADGSGNWSWTPSGLTYGDVVTALATDADNNTSQFSNNLFVQGLTPPTSTVTPTLTVTPTPTVTPTSALAGVDLGGKAVLAFPNPAKDQMKFAFHLDTAAKVKLEIYNLTGERLATLTDDLPAGRGQSLTWDLKNVAPGIYIARMNVDGTEKAKIKVAVVK